MPPPILVLSDAHAHAWSSFATTGADGVNSRLRAILDEIDRACDALLAAGGREAVFCGDLFHQRGSVDPEVFNPTHDAIARQIAKGVRFRAIPGNHDLKSKGTTALGNAFQSFDALEGFEVVTEPTIHLPAGGRAMALLPWCASGSELREEATKLAAAARARGVLDRSDLFMHAGVDGVLIGVPDHGLSADEVAAWGFRRVFAGDYHNHKVLAGGRFVSVGALTHQRYNDVGTLAGFLLVTDDAVVHHPTAAPLFVDLSPDTPEADVESTVRGNLVRVRGFRLSPAEERDMRAELLAMGAAGVVMQVTRPTEVTRGTAAAKGTTLEASVGAYVVELGLGADDHAAVLADCADVLSAVTGRSA